MALIIGAILALLSIGVVAYPFLKGRSWAGRQGRNDETGQGPASLESVFEALHTLQLDYQLGKIPEALYQEQLQAYRIQAALLLRQQDLQEDAPALAEAERTEKETPQ